MFIMKRFLLIFILTLSFQFWTKADDIRDFQIEGISLGDSLLDYFSEKEINKNLSTIQPEDKNFKKVEFYKKDFLKTYESIDVRYDANTFKINSIVGIFYFKNNDFFKCHNKRRIIDNDISQIFPDIEPEYSEWKNLEEDPSGNSFSIATRFQINKSEIILTQCANYTERLEKKEIWDHLVVGLMKFD